MTLLHDFTDLDPACLSLTTNLPFNGRAYSSSGCASLASGRKMADLAIVNTDNWMSIGRTNVVRRSSQISQRNVLAVASRSLRVSKHLVLFMAAGSSSPVAQMASMRQSSGCYCSFRDDDCRQQRDTGSL